MPNDIPRLLREQAFDPEAVAVMVTAFENALRELGLANRADPATEIVARKIIELAGNGERDPIRLCADAVSSIKK